MFQDFIPFISKYIERHTDCMFSDYKKKMFKQRFKLFVWKIGVYIFLAVELHFLFSKWISDVCFFHKRVNPLLQGILRMKFVMIEYFHT